MQGRRPGATAPLSQGCGAHNVHFPAGMRAARSLMAVARGPRYPLRQGAPILRNRLSLTP
jgi:hypothetical protein